ncbi:MAG: hypothetical protein ABIJ56_13810 [Pseudomonadota bacterium]
MGSKFDRALPGYNNNLRRGEKVYHIQTEDSGKAHPHIITHVFVDGNIVATKKDSYGQYLAHDDVDEVIMSMMKKQHKEMAVMIAKGMLDEKQKPGTGVERLSSGEADALSGIDEPFASESSDGALEGGFGKLRLNDLKSDEVQVRPEPRTAAMDSLTTKPQPVGPPGEEKKGVEDPPPRRLPPRTKVSRIRKRIYHREPTPIPFLPISIRRMRKKYGGENENVEEVPEHMHLAVRDITSKESQRKNEDTAGKSLEDIIADYIAEEVVKER